MLTGVEKIAAKAREDKRLVFTSLAHHITQASLWENLNKITPSTSAGIDGQDVKTAKETFTKWSASQLKEMHNRGYHPPPARRVYIPKPGKDEKRPISIPTVQDRCLQKAVTDVLNNIYEQDFQNCSYGGRPGRSAHQAIVNLQHAISGQKVNWIFEADLKNFFGSLNQDWVKQFLNHRVRDPRIETLIKRWMKAGVMDNGQHTPSESGTAQGGPISVLISNIYLHYVLDIWIERVIKPRMKGYVHYVRYLDDFVLCFENKADANRFRAVLIKRLEKFSLALEPTKTKLLEFGRFARERRGGKVETFNFLGFTFYCSKNLKGGFKLGIKTEKSRLNRSRIKMKERLRHIRHRSIREQWKSINVMLSGHYRYYGVGGNSRCIDHLYNFTLRYWRKTLSSRSQNGAVTWEKFKRILKVFPLCQPKIYLPYTAMRNLATL
jgi:RNA-directed DNA polymerase